MNAPCETLKTGKRLSSLLDLIKYYQIEPILIFELAKDQAAFSNVIHNLSGDSTVFNQSPTAINLDEKDKRIAELTAQVHQLIENDKFNKNLVEHQQVMIEKLLKDK
jgi:hypothetical protein